MDKSILNTRVREFAANHAVSGLVEELRSVRGNRALSVDLTVRQTLQEFYRDPFSMKHESLNDKHLLSELQPLLKSRVDKLPDELKVLVEELANSHGETIENFLHHKLHVALNKLMRLSIRRMKLSRRRA